MNALPAGALIALLVVGYPLWELVVSGQLDSTSALVRGTVVAVACTAGITAVVRLALSWESAAQRQQGKELDALYSDLEGAVADGTLTPEDGPTPPG